MAFPKAYAEQRLSPLLSEAERQLVSRRIRLEGWRLALYAASGGRINPGQSPQEAARVELVWGHVVLDAVVGGERVRYLLIDAPEVGQPNECYGAEAARFNRDLVERREVWLEYDVECRDAYDRLLAYVTVDDVDVSEALVERGYACVLHIPPNGADRVDRFRALQAEARRSGRGLWGACPAARCRR
jgi:micrococcal nuclease